MPSDKTTFRMKQLFKEKKKVLLYRKVYVMKMYLKQWKHTVPWWLRIGILILFFNRLFRHITEVRWCFKGSHLRSYMDKILQHILFNVYYVICTKQCHSCFVMVFEGYLTRSSLESYCYGVAEKLCICKSLYFMQQLLTQISAFQMQKVIQIKTN